MQVRQELPRDVASGPRAGFKSSVEMDSRAENNQRTVHFETDRIVIMRRIHGVSMRVTMPVQKYAGVGVLLPSPAEQRMGFKVMLVHSDPDLSITLFENSNPLLIDAAMSEWSQFFGLPSLVTMPPCTTRIEGRGSVKQINATDIDDRDGSCDACERDASLGTVEQGNVRSMRRRGSTLAKRRPRLYGRRKNGDLTRMADIFRNEREIIARN